MLARLLQRFSSLLRRSLQARSVISTVALSGVALIVLGGFLSFGIGNGLFQTRVQGVLQESERAVGEIQSTFAASSATDEVALQTLMNSVVPRLENTASSQTRWVALLREPGQQSLLLQSPISASLDTGLISTNIRERVRATDNKLVYQSVSIPVGTTAAQAAALIAAGISAETGPLSAAAAGSQVALYHRSGWYSKKLQVSSTEDATGQTYRLYDRHDAAGTISSVTTTAGSAALTGLPGAGAPTLTTLLGNASKRVGGFTEWSVDYLDSASTSAIYAHVEQYGNGYYQRNQRVTFVSTDPLEDAAAVATSASPQLGNSWRYSVGVAQGGACQGGAYSAQVAARLCATDLPYNMDGMQLVSGTIAPILPGRSDTDLTPTEEDVALGTYHLFPLKGINGIVTITRGKTTWTADNIEWGDWSYGRTFDAVRYGMRAFLNRRFRGRVLFLGGGTVRVPNGFTPQDVKDAIGEYLDSIDGVICDGARDLKRFIAVEASRNNPGFLRIFFRERPPRELHIISGVIAAAA